MFVKMEDMASMNGVQSKEPEACKLFVGQIPRTYEEKDVRAIFEEFGDIYDVTILRDRLSGHHRGCCFLTYYSKEAAKKAQDMLHERRSLPGMVHPLQVKPANAEKKAEDRKLFVGMISKKMTEDDLRVMFSPFGTIEELTVLKNPDSTSKGCAFIKFATRLQAQNAIRKMHNSQTMDGCTSPIVVKIADTERDKLAKKLQMMATNMLGVGLNMQMNLPTHPYAYQQTPPTGRFHPGPCSELLQQAMAAGTVPPGVGSNTPGTMGAIVAAAAMASQQQQQTPPQVSSAQVSPALQQQQQQQHLASQNASAFGTSGTLAPQTALSLGLTNTQTSSSNSLGSLGGVGGVGGVGGLGGLQGLGTGVGGLGQIPGLAGLNSQLAGMAGSLSNISAAFKGSSSPADAFAQAYSGIQQYTATFPSAYAQAMMNQATVRQPQKEGPDGANLFIYHLPQEFTDADLMQTFLPFGSVLSAKVFIDKNTNLSKCFGFVSYDNPQSAQAAINTMNGFNIGPKRLKVQLKRPKDANRPY